MANRLYVGNIPYSISEADLANFFASAGKVEKTSIVTDRDTGKPRGFGFVDMATDEEAAKAVETLNGAEMQGRPLVVNEARPKESKPFKKHHGDRPQGRRENFEDFGDRKPHSGGGRPRYDEGRSGGKSRSGWRDERRQNSRRGDYEDAY